MSRSPKTKRPRNDAPIYTYAELLAERGILRKDARVVEGCVGNTGWGASRRVAQYLGTGGVYYMVEMDPIQLGQHEGLFEFAYEPSKLGRPKLEWVAGRIEDQGALISGSDALLFHNYVPVDIETYNGKRTNADARIRKLFSKLVEAGPKFIAFYLPNFKDPNFVVRILESLDVRCEKVSGIDYAGNLYGEDRHKWVGKAIIGAVRT